MNWKRWWQVFRAYSANEEPPGETWHEWVADNDALEFIHHAAIDYETRLLDIAGDLAKESGPRDRHNNPVMTVEIASEALRRMEAPDVP